MAENKGSLISELGKTILNGTEQIPLEKGNQNFATTLNEVKEFVDNDAKKKYQPKGTYLTEHQSLAGYAKETYVKEEIARAQLSGTDVDLTGYATKEELAQALTKYVEKVVGKDLSTNDFTNVLKSKLEGLENYNDAAIRESIAAITARIDTLVGTSASSAIDTFNEIEAFLSGITDSQSLTAMLNDLKREITALIPTTDNLATKEEVAAVEGKIPTTTSKLQNDSNFVADPHYVHTDNNFTAEEKAKLEGLKEGGDGKSAYQIAVEKGFVGTEDEWLASLKGADGKPGAPGAKGDKGDQGNTGSSVDYPFELVNNLIEGGIDKALTAEQGSILGKEIYGGMPVFMPMDITLIAGEYVDGDGRIQKSSAYSRTKPIHLAIEEKIKITYVGKGLAPLSETDSSGNIIKVLTVDYSDPKDKPQNIEYVAEKDIYVCICGRTDGSFEIKVEKWANTTTNKGLKEKVQDLESKIGKVDVVDDLITGGREKPLSAEQGKVIGLELYGPVVEKPLNYTLKSGFIDPFGNIKGNSAYSYTSLIEVSVHEHLIIKVAAKGIAVVSKYSNGKYIPVVLDNGYSATVIVTYDYEADSDGFISVCGRTDSPFNIYIERIPLANTGLINQVQNNTNDLQGIKDNSGSVILCDFAANFTIGGQKITGQNLNAGYYIDRDGLKQSSPSFGITNPIQMSSGDVIVAYTKGSFFAVFSETDKSGASYKPIKSKGNDSSEFNIFSYSAKNTCYITACVALEKGVVAFSKKGEINNNLITSEKINLAPKESVSVTTAVDKCFVISELIDGDLQPIAIEVCNSNLKSKNYNFENNSDGPKDIVVTASVNSVILRKSKLCFNIDDILLFKQKGYSKEIVLSSFVNLAVLTDNTYKADAVSRSIVVPIIEGATYKVRKDASNRERIAILSSYPIMDGVPHKAARFINSFSEFTAGPSESFAVFMVSNTGETPHISVEMEKNTDGSESDTSKLARNSSFDFYEHQEGLPDLSGSLATANHKVVYDIFNRLKADYPNYVTIKTAGKSLGQQDIIAVEISTPNKMVNNTRLKKKRLRVYIIASIHGYEQMAGYALAKFMDDILRNENIVNNLLREYIDYYLIPVANPDGFDKNSRYNNNGVDLNRNFAKGWISQGGGHNSGSGPNSEPETNVVINYGKTVGDYDYYFDIHNIGDGFSCDPVFYVNEQKFANYGEEFFSRLSAYWINHYKLEGDKVKVYGRVSDNPKTGTSLEEMTKEKGVGCVLETPWAIPFSSKKYDKKTLETSVDIIGNLMLLLIKDYNKNN